MDTGQDSSSPQDSGTTMDDVSAPDPKVMPQDSDDVSSGEPILSDVTREAKISPIQHMENIVVPSKVNSDADKVEESALAQTQAENTGAIFSSPKGGDAASLQKTNENARDGLEDEETLHTDKGVHFKEDSHEKSHEQPGAAPQSGLSMGERKKRKKKKPKSQRGLVTISSL